MKNLVLLQEALEKENISYRCDEPMSRHTTFQIGGGAPIFIQPEGEDQAIRAFRLCLQLQIPYFVLGRGSNLLVSDQGPRCAILHVGEGLSTVRLVGETMVEAGAGISLTHLCRFAQRHALTGLEFAYGIPGLLGGGLYMNAGAYDGELKLVVDSVRWLDEAGELQEAPAKDLDFGYRHSYFTGRSCCILSAKLALAAGDGAAIQARMEELMERRRQKQPLEYGSGGSTFKRPKGAYASALIEQCGLKGMAVGAAQVSEKHAGFIINRGGATCAQVQELIRKVQSIVLEKTGYQLECEIREL